MLPWTSSDIFYYMGVGELNSNYNQNPYYQSIKEFCDENMEMVKDDEIMEKGYKNYWSETTVIYGPIAQLIFSIITKLSYKNVNLCLILFKLLNIIVHILNCYLIYKITKKIKFVIIYGLNPLILIEGLGMVHNDIIVVFFILLSFYFLLKKENLYASIAFLAIATGIKYFPILLLPVVILYYYRKETNLFKKLLKCIKYGLFFIILVLLEYAIYFRDVSIFTAMMVQNEKFSKSIYSSICGIGSLNNTEKITIFGNEIRIWDICIILRKIFFYVFVVFYVKFCIDIFTTKKIKWQNLVKKYNLILLLFILSLGTFQQWYIIWFFAGIFWQKTKTIKNIVWSSVSMEIANSVYMFKTETYKYDIFFLTTTFLILIVKKFKLTTLAGHKRFKATFKQKLG